MKDEMVGISDVYTRRSGMCVGLAIVSMAGTNFDDSKVIKGDSAPSPNEIGPLLCLFLVFFLIFFGDFIFLVILLYLA